MSVESRCRLLIKWNAISLVAVYFLVLVGGMVRSTGSGMGCPDWPKCFGAYVPPTRVTQLPEGYKKIYTDKRKEKNERLARVLNTLGFEQLAQRINSEHANRKEATFNATKTWIEYVNRLIGVAVGLLIVVCALLAYFYRRQSMRVFMLSLMALLLVVFQGWVGSIVVSTHLLPGMITFHMVLAIALIALLICIRFYLIKEKTVVPLPDLHPLKGWLAACVLMLLTQIVLGTQVREAIDRLAFTLGESNRLIWIKNLGLNFIIHRSFSWLILLTNGYLVFRLMKVTQGFGLLRNLAFGLMGLVLAEVIAGTLLAYFGLPYLIQPIHLLLALLIFGIQYFLYLIVRESAKTKRSLAPQRPE